MLAGIFFDQTALCGQYETSYPTYLLERLVVLILCSWVDLGAM